mmetsp:Transcript_81718/g.206332  ORF Transcript_81718/g.206332 Transcript_81718/m.206332 type:complete len:242 (-) Transcript_81718:297-1022(-)
MQLSNATLPDSSFFFGAGPVMIWANLLNASGAASPNLGRGAAKLMAYAAGIRTSPSLSIKHSKTAGMKAGHACSECSFKCWIMSQPKNKAKVRFCLTDNHCFKRLAHSGKHCMNSCGATSMTEPTASSRPRRQASSSPSASSSSSSCCSSGGAPAASAFRSCSALLVRKRESSMNLNICCTNCAASWALRHPGPTLFKHSAMPSAASRRLSGSESCCIAAQILCRKVRNNSLASVAGWLRS